MNFSNLVSTIVKESFIFFSLKILNIISSYFFTWYVGKYLGLTQLGNFTLFYSFIFAIGIIGRLGLDISAIKITAEFFFDKRILRLKQFIFISAGIILLFSSLVGLFSIAFLIILKKTSWFLLIWISGIFYSLYGFNLSLLRSLGKIFWFSLLQEGFIYMLTLVIFHVFYLSLQKSFLLSLIGVLILQKLILKDFYSFSTLPGKLIVIVFIKKIWPITIALYISQIIDVLLNWINIFFIQYFLGAKEVGLYQILLRLVTIISFLLTTINTIIAHRIAILFKKKQLKLLINLLTKINILTSLTGFLFVICYILFSKDLLNLFAIEQKTAYFALIIMALGQFINSWTGPVGLFLTMTNYQIFHRNTLLVVAVINLLLNIILIPSLGILGAAVVYSLTISLWNIIFAYKTKKVLNKWISFFPLNIKLK